MNLLIFKEAELYYFLLENIDILLFMAFIIIELYPTCRNLYIKLVTNQNPINVYRFDFHSNRNNNWSVPPSKISLVLKSFQNTTDWRKNNKELYDIGINAGAGSFSE